MRTYLHLAISAGLICPALAAAQAVVPKTNPTKVYVHMMPWFQTPKTLGGSNWGYHWTMNATNPNTLNSAGQREIASYYYPLTGPYDSTDPNIIEYQMLLMKLSGVNGVIVDWYGQQGTNGDINSLLTASNDIVNSTATYGLQFAACLEDRFAASTSQVTANINYLQSNYFTKSNYIHAGASNAPLLPIFGPVTYTQPSQWTTIMSGTTARPDILPLQYQSQQVGSYANGEFAWVYQDSGTSDYLSVLKNFLTQQAPHLNSAMGVAYPGFNAYYQAAGVSGPTFVIPSNNGQTLANVLSVDSTYASDMNMLQLATWNDYGEGTMFEPTVQTGFTYLMQLQQFTGVSYGLSQLEMVYQLYEERTAYNGNSTVQAVLNQASSDLNNLDFTDAVAALNQYQSRTWNGSATTNNWSNSTNWGSNTVVASNVLTFSGNMRLTSNNDFAAQTQFNGFVFAVGAGSFTLSGNAVNLYGNITNNSTALQSINLNLALESNTTVNSASGDISIAGSITDGLYGPASLTKTGANNLTLSASNSYSGGTIVASGKITVGNVNALGSGSVTINSGATLQLASTLHGVVILPAVSVQAGGTFDLGKSDLIINYSGSDPYGGLLASIQNGYDQGRWDGAGIRSSALVPGAALALYDNSIDTQSTLDGIAVGAKSIFIKYTWLGDANGDGVVNNSDLAMMQTAGTTWQQGDFNYDGKVNADDYALFGLGVAISNGNNITTVLPEPGALAACLIAAFVRPVKRKLIRGVVLLPGRSGS
ncbi:MAG TPA: autotransporter-associated beta strand repeat-containing protein [Tepidisphaeraceae bacterium]|jgi:autotransporter-associated beta strand protein